MLRRRYALAAIATLLVLVTAALVVRNQIKVYRGRQARAALMRDRHAVLPEPAAVVQQRQALFEMLQPVALSNCELERFGESHDGGYLMCGNLLDDVEAGYSYGIAGYDGWGCEVSSGLDVPVHQYDCFDTTQPSCFLGDTIFHAECVGDTTATIDGRLFGTLASQVERNGDRGRRIVLKIDVEGAEWDSLLSAPDELLAEVEQMAVEFHWVEGDDFRWIQDPEHLRVVERLKRFFEVAHIHYNNASCIGDLAPFPSWAYEVLFVNKRLAVVDPSREAGGLHPLDASNNPALPECQPEDL